MPKNWNFALFLAIFAVVLIGGPQVASAQDKPLPEVKEKAGNCDDDNDDEEVTEADRAAIRLSLKEAKRIALERVPGKVTDAELEKENGRLQYAFDIIGEDGKIYDVEIDAVTGVVIQVELEEDLDDEDEVGGPASKTVVKKKIVERTVIVAKKPQ